MADEKNPSSWNINMSVILLKGYKTNCNVMYNKVFQ